MHKILLVFEDYGELMALDSPLKRVGFDVLGISSEYSLSDQVLSFNPDLVIGSGRSGKVTSIGVGKRLKEMSRWPGKVILLFPANFKPAPQDLLKIRVDMILESPVPPLRIIQVLAKLLGHDEAALLERLNKAAHADSNARPNGGRGVPNTSTDESPIYVQGGAQEGSQNDGVSSQSFRGGAAADALPEWSIDNQVDSEDDSVSGENKSEKSRLEFRLGERMTSATPEETSFGAGSDEFADVDLKALERELLGTSAAEPEVERVDDSAEALEAELAKLADAMDASTAGTTPLSPLESLAKAEDGLAQKVARYSALVADVKVAPKSTVSRVEARKRQRQLQNDWDREELKSQDELRRQFTKGLFKK